MPDCDLRSTENGSTHSIVLVVDDDPQIRTIVRRALAGEPGIRVVAHADGEQGLLTAWELGPSLVLADLLMPGMDGATFCRILRAHPATALTPIVAVSAADPASPRARALRELCAGWLAKPFDVDELVAVVRHQLTTARRPAPRPLGRLSQRQRDVARLVARGMSNRAIGDSLTLTEGP